MDGGAWLIRTGVEGAWGNVGLRRRYLAGFGPDVVDPAGEWQGRSSWSRNRADAIRFPGRGGAGACCNAAPADALLRPGGTPDRPLSVYRVAVAFEPPGLPRSRRTLSIRAYWDGSTWTGLSDPPRRCPPCRRGTVPSRRLVATPVHPLQPACSQGHLKAS
jgi:hypothetical protein